MLTINYLSPEHVVRLREKSNRETEAQNLPANYNHGSSDANGSLTLIKKYQDAGNGTHHAARGGQSQVSAASEQGWVVGEKTRNTPHPYPPHP